MGVSPPFLPNLLEFSLFCNSPFQPSGPFCSPFSCDYRPPEKVSAKLWPGLCLYRGLPWEPTRPAGRAACGALFSDSSVVQSVTRSKPATILGNVARSIIAVWTDFMMKDTFLNLRERERSSSNSVTWRWCCCVPQSGSASAWAWAGSGYSATAPHRPCDPLLTRPS